MAQTAFAYGSVLEALSRGLYPDKRHIIREFVQNAFDSIYELRKAHPKISISPIEIKIQPPSITIADHGIDWIIATAPHECRVNLILQKTKTRSERSHNEDYRL